MLLQVRGAAGIFVRAQQSSAVNRQQNDAAMAAPTDSNGDQALMASSAKKTCSMGLHIVKTNRQK